MPETFDEVIKRGFPLGTGLPLHRDALAQPAKEAEMAARQAGMRLPALAAGAPVTVRKNQAELSDVERRAFRDAITQLVNDGTYLTLTRLHMDMSHNMHGSMGETGLYRFLAWHRRYVVAFERELQRADRIQRPTATQLLGVPYWRWQDDFPDWLQGFLPANDPDNGKPPPARKEAPANIKPGSIDIDAILNHFDIQITGIQGENDYTKFTYGIEGWGKRPDGSHLNAHNQGHAWIGGIMNNTSTSPTDPMFWLHHGEIDRLWQNWRQTHPNPAPPLAGSDRIMDPWTESYDEVLDIGSLGYSYDSLSP